MLKFLKGIAAIRMTVALKKQSAQHSRTKEGISGFLMSIIKTKRLLRRLAQLAPTAFGEGNRLFTEFKGALTENFVLQTLITQFEVLPRYWSQTNPPYEVDFLIKRENDIFPVEVKSEANASSKSLKKFKELFPDKVKLRVRFSLDNLKLYDDVLNIPLFLADRADRLIGLALEQRNRNQ